MDTKEAGPILPLGFCAHCLGELEAGAMKALIVRGAQGTRFAGAFCSHNRVAAVRKEFSDQEIGPWRLVTPATEATLVTMLRLAAQVAPADPIDPLSLH